MSDAVELTVGEAESGDRIDAILARHTGIARSRLVASEVSVDGSAARLKDRVAAGAVVRASVDAPVAARPQPAEIAFGVAYEDSDIVVVDKPAGLAVHAPNASGAAAGAYLVNGLLARYPEIADLAEDGARERPGIVHRLDRDTSGLLVVARTRAALVGLRSAVASRALDREYAAVAGGTVESPAGEIDAPIGRRPGSRTFAVRADGRAARTRYAVAARWDRPSLSALRVWLDTGRTHQIRVHLCAIGHPVLGDRTYRGSAVLGARRQFLHSHRLGFDHPCSGERVEAESALPADLAEVLAAAGEPDSGAVPAGWLRTRGCGG